jgi:hypothetical protein
MTHRWEIYCVDEGHFVFTDFVKGKPTNCPNDPTHQIAGATVVESKAPPTSMTLVFRDGKKPYVSYDGLQSGNYTEITAFGFEGTTMLDTVQHVRVLGHCSGTGSAIIRIIDTSTGLEIATGALPNTDDTTAELTLPEKWPSTAVPLSMQVKVEGTATVVVKSLTIIMFN